MASLIISVKNETRKRETLQSQSFRHQIRDLWFPKRSKVTYLSHRPESQASMRRASRDGPPAFHTEAAKRNYRERKSKTLTSTVRHKGGNLQGTGKSWRFLQMGDPQVVYDGKSIDDYKWMYYTVVSAWFMTPPHFMQMSMWYERWLFSEFSCAYHQEEVFEPGYRKPPVTGMVKTNGFMSLCSFLGNSRMGWMTKNHIITAFWPWHTHTDIYIYIIYILYMYIYDIYIYYNIYIYKVR